MLCTNALVTNEYLLAADIGLLDILTAGLR